MLLDTDGDGTAPQRRASDPLLGGECVPAERIRLAGLYIQDAFDNVERPQPVDRQRNLWLMHLVMHRAVRCSVIGLLLLSFFEQPAWLATRPQADLSYYPTFGLPVLPSPASFIVEATLLSVLLVDSFVTLSAVGMRAMFSQRRLGAATLFVGLATLDAVFAAVATAAEIRPPSATRIAHFTRLALQAFALV